MRKFPETAPSRQSRNSPRHSAGNDGMLLTSTIVAAIADAAPIRSRLRDTWPFSRAF